ncbi:hypothetical protein FRC07_008417, partial [Ceratobasidium sp. 392]
ASFLIRVLKAELTAGRYAEAATADSEIKTIQLEVFRPITACLLSNGSPDSTGTEVYEDA